VGKDETAGGGFHIFLFVHEDEIARGPCRGNPRAPDSALTADRRV
jgi:hypothetical protein